MYPVFVVSPGNTAPSYQGTAPTVDQAEELAKSGVRNYALKGQVVKAIIFTEHSLVSLKEPLFEIKTAR